MTRGDTTEPVNTIELLWMLEVMVYCEGKAY